MLFFVGLPLFYMEMSFGQFASLGPITAYAYSPALKGGCQSDQSQPTPTAPRSKVGVDQTNNDLRLQPHAQR